MPSISGDGRYVAFATTATNMVPDDKNNAQDVFVADTETGTVTRASQSADGTVSGLVSTIGGLMLSGDGRYVVFQSAANNLVVGDTNGKFDVFVRDRVSGTTERVSVGQIFGQANGTSDSGVISNDGTARIKGRLTDGRSLSAKGTISIEDGKSTFTFFASPDMTRVVFTMPPVKSIVPPETSTTEPG